MTHILTPRAHAVASGEFDRSLFGSTFPAKTVAAATTTTVATATTSVTTMATATALTSAATHPFSPAAIAIAAAHVQNSYCNSSNTCSDTKERMRRSSQTRQQCVTTCGLVHTDVGRDEVLIAVETARAIVTVVAAVVAVVVVAVVAAAVVVAAQQQQRRQ